MKILIVEDELKTGAYVQQGLVEAGFVVDLDRDGTDGLHHALTEAYDLLVLDVMLPGMNGLNILTELKGDSQTADIPVIMLTNYGSEDNVKKALENGAADYIMKYKILPSELSDKIEVVLGTSNDSDVRIAV